MTSKIEEYSEGTFYHVHQFLIGVSYFASGGTKRRSKLNFLVLFDSEEHRKQVKKIIYVFASLRLNNTIVRLHH